MMLLILAALLVCGAQGMSMGSEVCPSRDLDFHDSYTGGFRGVNKLETGVPRFGLNSEVYDAYEPGETYDFELDQSELSDDISHFYLVTTPLEDAAVPACPALGSWQQLHADGPKPLEGCEHVLEHRGGDQRRFVWTAPDCGCVTISAVVVNGRQDFFTDDVDKLQGPLTMTLCAEDDDDVAVPSLFDDEFYGIEEEVEVEEGLDMADKIMNEVTDIMTEEADDEEDEDEDEEEDTSNKGKWRKGWKNSAKGKGKSRGRGKWGRKNGEDDEDMKKGKAGRRTSGKVALMWKKKMGRKATGEPKTEAHKTARLEKLCTVLEEKANATTTRRSHKTTLLTEVAIEVRRERWATFREDMLVCCDEEEEGEESMVSCFKDAHGRRMTEKLCGASDEHFKAGEVPVKIQAAQEECCLNEGDEQRECLMDSLKIMNNLKRQQKRAGPMDKEAKVAAICKRVEKQAVPAKRKLTKLTIVQKNKWTALFTERRLQMAECCQLGEAEQESCLMDLKEQRLDRVCQGEEELSPPWGKRTAKDSEDVTEACCVVEDKERYECFAEKIMGPGHHRRGHKGHHGRRRPHNRHFRRGLKEDGEDVVDEDVMGNVRWDEEERKERRPNSRVNRMNKRRRVLFGISNSKKHGRVCCQGGRKAGTLLEELSDGASKWQTCQQEAQGYVVEAAAAVDSLCLKSFRKCCMKTVIRTAREEAVEKAEEDEEDMAVEEL